jgi:hypothetical protein
MSFFKIQGPAKGSLLGGLFLALAALVLGRWDLSVGILLGTLASILNFWGLERLTQKTLSGELRKGLAFFWFFNLARWILFVLACWFFWKVSPDCFFGACLGYFWCLGVLLVAAWRRRNQLKIS